MTTPFLQHNLFEINDDLKPQLNKLGPYEYLSIDNFYKRPEDIHELLKNSWAQGFKVRADGKNFIEYFDCYMKIPIHETRYNEDFKTTNYLKSLLSLDNHYCSEIHANIFSWINTPSQEIQFCPHQDGSYNILIYLDKINSGGTALYNKMPKTGLEVEKDFRYNINQEMLEPVIIPSEFNKCVIFDGNIPHGGYIEDHSKYSNNNWRYNLVYFFNKHEFKFI